MRFFLTFVALLFLATACSQAREYELRGQVLAIDAARQEITIKHEDVKGFMPAMTMPFKVTDAKLLEGRQPGELVTATLVVSDSEGRLSAITRTGTAPLPAEATPAVHLVDVLEPGETAPDVVLVDQDAKNRRVSEWRGKVLVVTFVYTRCPLPDFCPRMDRNFAEAQRAISGDRQLASGVHLLSVSFDPEYDTPKVLAEHAQRVGATPEIWTYATGDRAAIETLTERFGVSVISNGKDAGDIVHNLRTAVLDRDGKLVAIFNGNDWTVEELLKSIRDASANRT